MINHFIIFELWIILIWQHLKALPDVLNIEINSIGIHGEFYITTASTSTYTCNDYFMHTMAIVISSSSQLSLSFAMILASLHRHMNFSYVKILYNNHHNFIWQQYITAELRRSLKPQYKKNITSIFLSRLKL